MRRRRELIAKILLYVQTHSDGNACRTPTPDDLQAMDLPFGDRDFEITEEDIFYHVKLCKEKELLQARTFEQSTDFQLKDLTWDGHDYVENILKPEGERR